jgi:2'-5' RNA ligase
MRLFVGADIGEESRQLLGNAQRRFRHVNARVTWVAPRNFHFTLKFLGEVAEERVAGIQYALAKVAGEFPPIGCEIRGLGQFPRVIWAGLYGEIEPLEQLTRHVEAELVPLGFPREDRGFKPHLTLGRIKYVGDKQGLTKVIDSLTNEPFGALRVDAIHLFQSTLTPHGSIYTKLFTAPLKGADHGHEN